MLRHTLFAAAAILSAAPASAQTPDPDVKCMMVSNVFATRETEPKKRQIAILSVAYYLGRIDAKLSPAQYRAAVALMGKQPMSGDVAQVMTNCARALQAKQVGTAQMLQQLSQQAAQTKGR